MDYRRERTSKALRAKHLTKYKKRTIDRTSERRNERIEGQTDGQTNKQTNERTNKTQTNKQTTEWQTADRSRVFQCRERPWVQIWLITVTDSLSSVSSIFCFSAQWLSGCHASTLLLGRFVTHQITAGCTYMLSPSVSNYQNFTMFTL